MRVFVAGATGALGVPLVRQLVAAGHEVTGLTRFDGKRASLEALGAKPAVGDALDADGLRPVMSEARPDAVIHALTALPKRGPLRASELRATNEVRITGTRNLLAAAVDAGARRFVAESIVLVYGYSAHGNVFTEESPILERSPVRSFQPGLDAVRSLEQQVLEATDAGRIEGVPLRYGFFYGPGSGSTRYMVRMLRRRMLPLPGGGKAVASWIHEEDAASATVAALDRGRGGEIYNVVDDEPVALGAFVREMARAVGAPAPFSIPAWLAWFAGSYLRAAAQDASQAVSNRKAKDELGWIPAYPTFREGIPAVAAAVRGRN